MIIKYWNISTQANKANILHAIPCLFNIPKQTHKIKQKCFIMDDGCLTSVIKIDKTRLKYY